MAQRIRLLAAGRDNLSSIPETHRIEGARTSFHTLIPPHVRCGTYMLPSPNARKINKCKKYLKCIGGVSRVLK